jgi:polyisoprenoid-binding protein YceI
MAPEKAKQNGDIRPPEARLRDADSAAEQCPQHFDVDARASRFTVQAFASGVLSAVGHNPTIGIRKFSAEAGFNPDAVEQTRVRMTIQAGFLSVLDDIKESDRNEMEKLMNEQILESARYPEIQYEGTAVSIHRLGDSLYSADLGGNLSLHGVVRPQLVTVRITLYDGMLRASGTFSILQSEFQIKPISLAGGMLKLKDELKCSFEMIARKQD